jgi:hypothetical protein
VKKEQNRDLATGRNRGKPYLLLARIFMPRKKILKTDHCFTGSFPLKN